MAVRYDSIQQYAWAYQPEAVQGLDTDLAALEALSTGGRVMQVSQAEYDALTPEIGILYAIVEPSGVTMRMLPASGAIYVQFTTTGATFLPNVELVAGSTATVYWAVEGGATATGTTPTINFGTAATRHVWMSVIADGASALADVITLNLGFDNADDAGRYQMGAVYNWPMTAVSAVDGLTELTGLRRFAAARTPLTSVLNFTGLTQLQYIECAYSTVIGVTLTGCTSLVRLCLEQTNQTRPLDLNPVAANLYDLRSAAQRSGALTFVPITSPLAHLYHCCIRDQVVTNHPTAANLPVVDELWDWNTGQVGARAVASSALRSWSGFDNQWTSVDLSGTAAMNGTIDLHGNALTSAAVDAVLTTVQGWNNRSGTLNLAGSAAPSAGGGALYGRLSFRNWNVTTASVAGRGVVADDFTRADVVGLTGVGNGWYTPNDGLADIVGGSLVRRDSAGYQRVVNPGGAALPADYTVTAVVGALTGGWYGIIGRWDGVTGVRVMFQGDRRALTIGTANGYNANNLTLGTVTYPAATWDNDAIDHTIAMRMVGDQITVVLDGSDAITVTLPAATLSPTVTGTGYGICGEGNNRAWRSIGTTVP